MKVPAVAFGLCILLSGCIGFHWTSKVNDGAGGSGGRSFFKKFSLFVAVLIAVLAVVVYLESGKVPRNMVIAAIVVPLIGLQFHIFTKTKPQKTADKKDARDAKRGER